MSGVASASEIKRKEWKKQRTAQEDDSPQRSSIKRRLEKTASRFIRSLIFIFSKALVVIYPLYRRGKLNALQISTIYANHYFHTLPSSFDGMKILHISDLHLDERPELAEIVAKSISKETYDLCVFTGDYFSSKRRAKSYFPLLKLIIDSIDSSVKCYGVLGNHDSQVHVAALEEMGMDLLINEKAYVHNDKNEDIIQLIGVDDVYSYFTQSAVEALSCANENFSIALVHSPELYDYAHDAGIDLYLCGHTHGGQIRLADKIPIFKHITRGRAYYSRHWKYKEMLGYTSHGVGTSTLSLRFYAPAEITMHVLHKSD